jgi:Cu2+-exporting ATPase
VLRQNLSWALAYNLVALPFAMAGWVAPWQAALGMAASSLLVTFNALRLQRLGSSPAAPAALPANAGPSTAGSA